MMRACVLSRFSHVQLFVTPWAVVFQAPPSLGLSRQENLGGLPFPSPGDHLDPGVEPASLMPPALQVGSVPLSYLESLRVMSDPVMDPMPILPLSGGPREGSHSQHLVVLSCLLLWTRSPSFFLSHVVYPLGECG